MRPQIAEPGSFERFLAHESANRHRDDDLASVGRSTDPRRAVDVQPDVPLRAERGLPGVKRGRAGRSGRRATPWTQWLTKARTTAL